MKHFTPTHSSFEVFSVKQQEPFRTRARFQWRLILSFRRTEPLPNNFPLLLYFLNDDMSQQIGQWLLCMTFQYRAQFPRLHKGRAAYVRVKSRTHVSYIFNFRLSPKWHPERINVLISLSMFNKPNVELITFIQPWYKALRSGRSSGTLNTVVSSINACIYLIAQTFEYSNCKTSWDCFSIGTQIFSHLLYRTFSLKNVASIVTQFDLLSCLFSACKSKKEIKGVFQVYLEIHSQSASATCCYA